MAYIPLNLTIVRQGSHYTFIWNRPHPGREQAASAPDVATECLAITDLHPQHQAEIQAAIDSAVKVANLLQQTGSAQTPEAAYSNQALKSLGRVLFSQLLPPLLQDDLRRLASPISLKIKTNDRSLPWELLHNDQEFLALQHSVGRQLLLMENPPRAQHSEAAGKRRDQRSCLLIGNPTDDLPAADAEIDALLEIMDNSARPPRVEFLCRSQATKVRVLAMLARGGYDLIHFACHASPGALCLADQWLTIDEIRSALRGSPLVFLNGCSSARPAALDSSGLPFAGQQVQNLASAFLLGGASAFIGTCWPVADDSTSLLSIDFYRALFNGFPVGEALRLARLRRYQATSNEIVWAAPILYGDPASRFIQPDLLRRPGTVLHIRLAASTGQEEYHSIDYAAHKVAAEVAHIRDLIAAHGGTVATLADDRITAVFGIPQPFEDDAVRAINTAMAIQRLANEQGIAQPAITITSSDLMMAPVPDLSNTQASHTQASHTQAAPERNMTLYLGAAFAEARELSEHMKPGQIVAGNRTRQLADSSFHFVPIGAEPSASYEVLPRRVQAEPSAAHTGTPNVPNGFIGRDTELAALAAHWQNARQGKGQVLGIVGEPGVGKTRLIAEFRRALGRDECIWFSLTCSATAQEIPYALVSQLLRKLFQIAPDEADSSAEAKIEAGLRELTNGDAEPQLVPILKETLGLSTSNVPVEERRARRGRLVHLLRNLMARTAARTPLIISIDDAHWIDDASLEILDQVTDGIERLPVQVMIVYRPEWQHNWFQKHYYRHLPLDHLSETACLDLLCALLKTRSLPRGLSSLLVKTGGNPFFIEQIVKSLQETEILIQRAPGSAPARPGSLDGEAWELRQPLSDMQLPGTVQRALLVRFAHVPAEAHKVLEAASAIGTEFEGSLLKSILGHLDDALDEHLTELEDRNFLYSDWNKGSYRFRHALVRDTIYQNMPINQRQSLHRRIGDALTVASKGAEVAVEALAHHYYHSLLVSRPGEPPLLDAEVQPEYARKVAGYLVRSGKRSQERYAAREALNYYWRALAVHNLSLADPQDDASHIETEIEIREGLGDAHNILGDFDAAHRELRQAYAALHSRPFSTIDRRRAADMARRIGRLCMWTGKHDAALRWMEQGLRELGALDDTEDKAVAALLKIHIGSVYYNLGQKEAAFQIGRAGLDLADAVEQPSVQAEGHNLMGVLYSSERRNVEALDHYRQSLDVWQRLGNRYEVARIESNIGVVYFDRAEFAAAYDYCMRSLAYLQQIEDQDRLAYRYMNLGNIHLCQGEWEKARKSFELALSLWDKAQNRKWTALAHTNLGLLFIEQQAWHEAQQHLDCSLNLLVQTGIQDLLPEVYMGMAEVALGRGEIERSLELARQGAEMASLLKMPFEEALAIRTMGRSHLAAGRYQDALSMFERSLDLLEQLESRYEIARTYIDYARLHVQMDDHRAAQIALTKAARLADEIGAGGEKRKLHAFAEQVRIDIGPLIRQGQTRQGQTIQQS